MSDRSDRALGALVGLAAGDALGMPTQMLPRPLLVERYGPVIQGFEPAPPDHPLAAGMPAGAVTDDTEQALLLGQLLLDGDGTVVPAELAHRLVAWETSMRDRGSLDLLGPSTRRALTDLLAGADPDQAGRFGDTNGAAMRIAPIGIATPADPTLLVDAVVQASSVTHNTGIALAGAAAIAAAVSAAVDGAELPDAIELAVRAARLAAMRGHWVAGADVAGRIRWAVELVSGLEESTACDIVYRLVGTSLATQESVPAAFALSSVNPGDPWRTCRLAASVGGDCDTIAAMAGAVAGACAGADAFPREVVEKLEAVNHLGLAPMATALLALRDRARNPGSTGVGGNPTPGVTTVSDYPAPGVRA